MKNQIRMTAVLMFSALSLLAAGCANEWRNVSAELSQADMESMLGEIQQNSQAQTMSTGSLQDVLAMKDDPNARIYFAYADNSDLKNKAPMGPAGSILSLNSFDFLGLANVTWRALVEARVFFFDVPAEGGRQAGLIIGLRTSQDGALQYVGLKGTSSIADGELTAELSGGARTLYVRSYDVDGGELDQVIQLQAFEINDAGAESYIGKFSTLYGFGP